PHAGRDLDRDRLLALHAALPLARRALLRDHAALPLARRARLDVDELAEERVRHLAELPAPVAGGARLEPLDAGRRAGALAGLALDELPHLQLPLDALGDLLEREGEADAEVGAGAAVAAPPPARAAEDVVVAAGRAAEAAAAEDVGERGEDVRDVAEAGAAGAAGAGAADAGAAEPVVARALVGVGEDLVGLGGLLEARLGLGIARVPVRVILHGLLPVGLLDLVGRRRAGHAQHVVVVPHRGVGGHGAVVSSGGSGGRARGRSAAEGTPERAARPVGLEVRRSGLRVTALP